MDRTVDWRHMTVTANYDEDVGFEVLTPVVKKNIIFCDMTPCSPLKVNWHFRRNIAFIFKVEAEKDIGIRFIRPWRRQYVRPKRRLTFNGLQYIRKISTWKQVASRVTWLIRHWRWRRYVPPKRWLAFNGLQDIISQKIVIFMRWWLSNDVEGT
jgi:hypothetical protein